MNKMIAVFIASILLAACTGDGGKSSSDIRRQAKEAIQADLPPAAPEEENLSPTNNIRFILPQGALASGDTRCFDVKVADFQNILAMQYTLRWDKNVLEFIGVQEFGLPFMGNDKFGLSLAAEGKLTAIWIEEALKGMTLPDNSSIYQICFKGVGKPGTATEISVSGNPTPIEVVAAGDKVWGIDAEKGKITIQ